MQHNQNFLEIQYYTVQSPFHDVKFWLVGFDIDMQAAEPLKKDIISIESLQRKFTKKIPGTLGLSYHSKLKALNLESLELRRLRADLLLAYKILIVNQQSAMMKTDAGTCACLSISLLTTSSRLSNHFLLYTQIDLRFWLYQQSNQTSHSDQPKIYSTVFFK